MAKGRPMNTELNLNYSINTSNMKMIYPNVAVKAQVETETKGGIVIPSMVKHDRQKIGTVSHSSLDHINEGDKIIFLGWSEPVKVEGEEYFIVHEDDIKAIL